jgi:hypothetical protein
MPQEQRQRLHACLPQAQKIGAIRDQRLQRFFQIQRAIDFAIKIAPLAKAFAWQESTPRHRRTRERDI